MRKRWLVIFLMIWILAGVHILKTGLLEKEEQITQVFGRIGTEDKNSQTEYFGKLKTYLPDTENRKIFLGEIAQKLGLEQTGEAEEEKKDGHILTQIVKEGARAKTELKILTLNDQDQYLCVRISFEDDLYSAMYYRTQLQDLLEDEVEDGQNTTMATGFYEGKLTNEEKDEIADGILESFGAHVVSENRTERLYTVYGYTSGINDYIMQGDYAINVNVAITYEEERDRTHIYVAIPVMNEPY
ncbi:MAG: YwmB family TATA-box binding protein [Lachnospiraceae bacterium]|nr:YwmB family TATA-box binding protein [Robinsoniella sp.]MDY3765580.1 YwmB family TATA-box binding protein [Lachnospiraceae bacterium]